jgi:hypothetical protein
MRLILDTVDVSFYGDIILTPQELDRLKTGEMVDTVTVYEGRKFYLGVRLNGIWEHNEKEHVGIEKDR